MKLHVKPNEESGFWEIHDENGFLCHLESESMAALIVHAANVLPQLVAFLQAANEAVGNCEESLEGHIEIRGWLADRLPRLIERATNTHP